MREGLLTDGGSVLDVGAGLGNYAFLFAQSAGRVDCLDISPAMVGAVRERAKAEGIENITAKLSDWESFQSEERYDLVFSSFCPAVEGQTSLLRMERMSKGFCCYVALSGSDRDRTEQEIWQRVHGGSLPEHSHEAILPFNLLYCLGRNPSLRTFSSTVRYEVEEELLCQYYLRHLSRMGDLDQGAEDVIREVVRNHCDDGVHKAHGDFTVAMIYWRPLR
jgi:SAM-dependent methyltransferase